MLVTHRAEHKAVLAQPTRSLNINLQTPEAQETCPTTLTSSSSFFSSSSLPPRLFPPGGTGSLRAVLRTMRVLTFSGSRAARLPCGRSRTISHLHPGLSDRVSPCPRVLAQAVIFAWTHPPIFPQVAARAPSRSCMYYVGIT